MSGDVQTKYPPGFKSLSASIKRRPSIPCNMNVNKSQGAKILIKFYINQSYGSEMRSKFLDLVGTRENKQNKSS